MEDYLELENLIAEWSKAKSPKHVVACSSGTAALHLALEALELPPDSYVIVPDFTMVACARAVVLAGLRPIFIDCNQGDMLATSSIIRDLGMGYNPGISAVMLVHVYGRHHFLDSMTNAVIRENGWKVIEDLSEAHGLAPQSITDAACWSFYKNKVIAGEEGGAIRFSDELTAAKARCLRSLGFTDNHDFYHEPRGMNYRLANCLARLVLNSFAGFKDNVEKRRIVADCYLDEINRLKVSGKLKGRIERVFRDVNWVYDFRLPGLTKENQDKIVGWLNKEGIPARHAFKPMSSLPEFRRYPRYGGTNAYRASREVIYLPIDPNMDQHQVKYNCEILAAALDYVGYGATE